MTQQIKHRAPSERLFPAFVNEGGDGVVPESGADGEGHELFWIC